MVIVEVTRAQPPVGVLLGGSGRARTLPVNSPQLSALLKPAFQATGPDQGQQEWIGRSFRSPRAITSSMAYVGTDPGSQRDGSNCERRTVGMRI